MFASALDAGGTVKALRVPNGGRLSNSRLKPPKGDVAAEATAAGAGGLVFMRYLGKTLSWTLSWFQRLQSSRSKPSSCP